MLDIQNLKVDLHTDKGNLRVVDDISFKINEGETVGIVGESGSGKSVLALSIMQLLPNASFPGGQMIFQNQNMLNLNKKDRRKLRGKEIAMVFQDPMTSLNPVVTIGKQLIEAIRTHQKISKKEAKHKAYELLADVGIPDPLRRLNEYPHQFSGGMRQRVLIAMALSCNPKLLIADEPTTALDVTIQAQIIELLKKIQNKYKMAILIITHDLGIVARMADRVMVMYAGKIVEKGNVEDIFYRTAMPYTWSLLRSIPRIESSITEATRLPSIKGIPPNLRFLPKGCNFSPRCPFARPECSETVPELIERSSGHAAACILSAEDFDALKREAETERKDVAVT